MYQKYTTDGFLVSSHPSGEADRVFLFLTREFGMIRAHATSVRHSKSKLRPHIAAGALLSLTFLRSKIRWRILEVAAPSKALDPQSAEYKTFAQIMLVLKSLIQGEEKNESLFESVMELYKFLSCGSPTTSEMLSSAECLAMIKILHALGYGEPKGDIVGDDAQYNEAAFENINAHKKDLIAGINSALADTGL
ncbi:MAG: recombination protein O N-terminal domain-containing protein [Patescibacteria group bacterium]